jgi:hypothetical protein
MKRAILLSVVCILLIAGAWPLLAPAQTGIDWSQWGRDAQHTGSTPAIGQSPNTKLANVTYDPFVSQETAEAGGNLLAHYQAPLVHGDRVFLEFKTGTYISCDPPGSGQPFPCGPDAWNSQIWNERAFTWQNGSLVQQWNFESDWKPEPSAGGLGGWEPVFHAALGNGFVFVPGFGGSIYKLNEADGAVVAHYRPFGPTDDPNKFVSGPLTVDRRGNVYYNVIALSGPDPWGADVRRAWLVRVSPQGAIRRVTYAALVPDAPSNCGGFPCGGQRPGVNVAPVVSNDGQTIYTVSRAHFASDFSYMVAANADLTPKWHSSLRNLGPSHITGIAYDLSSSTPVVAPDGSVLYGAQGGPEFRGYLLKFSSSGQFLAAYDFGWDSTPAIYRHDGTYSVIIKDNHYVTGGPFYITQLNADLAPEWRFRNPSNLEWCVNAPAVDANGIVYANNEDGNVYAINQGGTQKGKIFLRRAIGAAYTPVAIGLDGKLYTENDGDMFVVGQ